MWAVAVVKKVITAMGADEDIHPMFPRCTSSTTWFLAPVGALCEVRKAIYESKGNFNSFSLPTHGCHLHKSLLKRVTTKGRCYYSDTREVCFSFSEETIRGIMLSMVFWSGIPPCLHEQYLNQGVLSVVVNE